MREVWLVMGICAVMLLAGLPLGSVEAGGQGAPAEWESPWVYGSGGGCSYYEDLHSADVDGDGVDELLAGSWKYNRIEVWDYDTALGTWSMVNTIPQPHNVREMATGDFDEDGDLDIVTAVRYSGIYISFNTGGGWSAVTQIHWQYGSNVVAADLNGDGHLDLFCRQDSPGQARIFYGNGDGTFVADTNPTGFINPASPFCNLYPGDLDGDGDLDLFGSWTEGWGGPRYAYVRGFINKGNDVQGKVIWGTSPSEVLGYYTGQLGGSGYYLDSREDAWGDLNGDGYLDWVAFKVTTGQVIYLKGYDSGGGKISWQEQVVDTFASGYMLSQVCDVNGDGHLDIVTGGGGQYGGVNNVYIYYGDGAGNFAKVTHTLGYGAIGQSYVFGDFNDDGAMDLGFGRSVSMADGFEVWLQKPSDPITLIENLIDDKEGMGLHQGIENSLDAKLDNALKSLEKENYGAAINQLGAFINECEAQAGKKLTQAQADELVAAAEVIIEGIEGGMV